MAKKAETTPNEEQANPQVEQNQLPKGWTKVEIWKMVKTGFKDGKAIIKEERMLRTATMPSEQLKVLNSQTPNTLKLYKAVK